MSSGPAEANFLAVVPDPRVREVQPGAVIEGQGWTVRGPRLARAALPRVPGLPHRQRRGFALLRG